MFNTTLPQQADNGTVFSTRNTPKRVTASRRRPGNFTANRKPSCTASEAKTFATTSRQQRRSLAFLYAMAEINKKAGGEPRARRRSMALDLAKRAA